MRALIAVPVFNEAPYVERVLRRIRSYADHVLVIDDGSTDGTPELLEAARADLGIELIRHKVNAGYGRALRDAFEYAQDLRYDWLITMDCDEQHEPDAIPAFMSAARAGDADVISGSRYLRTDDAEGVPPVDRRRINLTITEELNERLSGRLGGPITDAFCGFKALRVDALAPLSLSVDGYAMPMQFWVQAAAAGLRVTEIPVKLIYNDPTRTFGGGLDIAADRLAHYREVLHVELCRCADRLPDSATAELVVGCG
jgi:glycosyltransferase involved in cell wall biosynthesis